MYKYDLICQKKMWYSTESMWGVYAFKFLHHKDQVNSGVTTIDPRWGTFKITGDVQELTEGETYTVTFDDDYNEKFGKGYKFTKVFSEGLKSASSQIEFLRSVIGVQSAIKQIEEIHGKNDNLLEDIISGKIDLKDLKGIGESKNEKALSKIVQYKDYQEAIQALSPAGASIDKIVSMSDYYGSPEKLVHIVNTDIYRLTEQSGLGFKRVDEFALNLGYKKSSPTRIRAGAKFVLEQMSTYGDIKIPVEDFEEQMCKTLEVTEISDELFNTILSDDSFHYDEGYISLEYYRNEELLIAEKILTLLENPYDLTNDTDRDIDDIIEEKIKENEEINGWSFNEQQREAIYGSVNNGVYILTGFGGTGKSSCVKTIVDIFHALNKEPAACALSGKASNVLIQAGVENSSTIHRLLAWSPKEGGFRFNEENRLKNELIILDEASMVNNTIFLSLLRAIDVGARFLIVGDDGQLPPIGHGAVFTTLLREPNLPTTSLTEVHRQAAKSGALITANKVREGIQINNFNQVGAEVIGENKDMRLFSYRDKTKIYDDIMQVVQRYKDNPNMNNQDLQVITAMKKGELGTPKLNEGIQEILNPHPEKGEKLPTFTSNKIEFRLGDRVIQSGNLYETTGFNNLEDYKKYKDLSKLYAHGNDETNNLMFRTDVYNGTIGTIIEIIPKKGSEGGVLIEFENFDGKQLVLYENSEYKSEIGMLNLAYAVTCHRSQGSGFKTVIFAFDYSAYMLLNREFVYTGITRTIDSCLMFVENSALHFAIKKTEKLNRKTYMREYIAEHLKGWKVIQPKQINI